jgi:putative phosphoribosyl transferase
MRADDLSELRGRDALIVLGLPRGGIPVAYEVARALEAPLDACSVRKLGVPGHEELAMGAIATGDVTILNDDIIREAGVSQVAIDGVVAQETRELQRRERLYRGTQPPPDVEGRTVILVDDGLATGTTMRAAVRAVRQLNPRSIVVAVPVAAPSVCRSFEGEVDRIVCSAMPDSFYALGLWYEDFAQTTDQEVRELLAQANGRATQMGAAGEHNLGQLARQRHDGETTHHGTVTAASDWDLPAERKQVRPGLPGSYEVLFHDTGLGAFMLPLADADPRLNERGLERAIGVIYRPETERISHYFDARLMDQFDAVLHIDETAALVPLEPTDKWDRGEMPETWPFADDALIPRRTA